MRFHVETRFADSHLLADVSGHPNHETAEQTMRHRQASHLRFLTSCLASLEARLRSSILDLEPGDDSLPDIRVDLPMYTYRVVPCNIEPASTCTACLEAGLVEPAPNIVW